MATDKRKRMSFDFSGLEELIDGYRNDGAWLEMTFKQRVRTMIRDAYDKRDTPNPKG